jgi:hypothetical protein
MRLFSSTASLSRMLAGQRLPTALDQLRQVSTSNISYQQEAKNDPHEPSTSPGAKDMNYCTAVNDALHKIMASNPKLDLSLFFTYLYTILYINELSFHLYQLHSFLPLLSTIIFSFAGLSFLAKTSPSVVSFAVLLAFVSATALTVSSTLLSPNKVLSDSPLEQHQKAIPQLQKSNLPITSFRLLIK